MKNKSTPEQIDAVLPQTQCGLCGYNGCMPYAEALAKSEATIDLCPPGGVPGLVALAKLLDQDPAPFIEEMKAKTKPASVAMVREEECIGCTKCIQACPVDAILGGAKQMHTVISAECTGCELCIAPCPVDCIDMIGVPLRENLSDHYRNRYRAREKRLQKNAEQPQIKKESRNVLSEKKSYIYNAILRSKAKRDKA